MSRKKPQGDDFKREDVLQAVVICESFNERFAPLTEEKPTALLPLANVPLIDYTLHFLCSAGVQEAILFCKSNVAAIRSYLKDSKWMQPTCNMKIDIMVSEDCTSMGDALRDIEAKSLIHSDFILLYADVVANVNMQPIIEEHKQRRLKEKTPVMTLLMKNVKSNALLRRVRDEETIVASNNSRIYAFRRVGDTRKKFEIPLDVLKKCQNMMIDNELMDCQVAICSPLVPTLFQDNFDFLTREDFIKGILENEEIMGNTIHMHVLQGEFAARVSAPNMYDAISHAVMQRWSYPCVPDHCITDKPDDRYGFRLHHIYRHNDVTVSRGSLEQEVIIGKGSEIGKESSVTCSVIGKNCKIGQNVSLNRAYLLDGVVIEDNCRVTSSILGNKVHLKAGVTVALGCILGDEVVVGPNISLPQGTALTTKSSSDGFGDDDDDDDQEEETDKSLVGGEGRGHRYCPAAEDSDDSEAEEEDDEDEKPPPPELMGERIVWPATEASDSEDEEEEAFAMDGTPPPDEFRLFGDEVIKTLERALEENINLENIILEINSLKHGYGIQIREVNQLVTQAMLQMPIKPGENPTPAEYYATFVTNFKKFKPVLKNYIRSEESQLDCLNAIEDECVEKPLVSAAVVKLLHLLYEEDIVSEEVICRWHEAPPQDENSEESANLKTKLTAFVNWLQEAEEETSDEDSD